MSVPWKTVERAARQIRVIHEHELREALAWSKLGAKESPYLGVRESCQNWVEVLEAIARYRGWAA